MSKEQKYGGMTLEELGDKIGYEGFDYFFSGYISYDKFEGTELYPLARNFFEAREALKTWLDNHGIDPEQ